MKLNKTMNKIKQIRIEKGLTQQELAQLVGISRQSINNIENNKFIPKLNTFVKICEVLKVNVHELI